MAEEAEEEGDEEGGEEEKKGLPIKLILIVVGVLALAGGGYFAYTNFFQEEPIEELNDLTVKNFETVVGLQLKNAEENAKIGIEQAKSATAINDAEGWKGYMGAQAEITQQFNERLLESTKNVVELGNAYNTEFQRIVKDAFSAK